jgi:nitrogen regulatory protein PII
MKTIKAILQPTKLDHARNTLMALGISGMTVSEVKGFGRQRGHTELYRGAEYTVDFNPKVELEIVVEDSLVEPAIETLIAAVKTGKIGDGKIFVFAAEQAIRIRTRETGNQALSAE